MLRIIHPSRKTKDGKSISLPEERELNIMNPLDKNQNPEYNGVINPKIMNNLKPNSHQKMGSVLRVDVKTGNDMSEGKIVEELMNVVKVKFNKGSTSPEREGKLLLNMRPLMKTLVEVLDNILSQNFNIFELEAHCYQNSVFVLMNYYFYNYNWSSLKISETKYMNLVYNIQKQPKF